MPDNQPEVIVPTITFIEVPIEDKPLVFTKQFEGLDEIVIPEASKYTKDLLQKGS